MRAWLRPLMALLVIIGGPAAAEEPDPLFGHWRTVRHGAEVVISDCGNGSPCGYLVAVDDAITGGKTRDERNSDPSLRDRPLAGLPLLWGFTFEDGRWRRGRLYNPDTGQTFRSTMYLISDDALRVEGCLGVFCRSQTWTRIHRPGAGNLETPSHD